MKTTTQHKEGNLFAFIYSGFTAMYSGIGIAIYMAIVKNENLFGLFNAVQIFFGLICLGLSIFFCGFYRREKDMFFKKFLLGLMLVTFFSSILFFTGVFNIK